MDENDSFKSEVASVRRKSHYEANIEALRNLNSVAAEESSCCGYSHNLEEVSAYVPHYPKPPPKEDGDERTLGQSSSSGHGAEVAPATNSSALKRNLKWLEA